MARTWIGGRRGLVAGWIAVALIAAVWLRPGVSARDEGKPAAGALPADLDRVPRDAVGFLSVRVADFWNGPFLKGIRARIAKEAPEALKAMEKELGARPQEIERLTFVLTDLAPGSEPVALVGTVKPYDRTRVLEVAGAMPKEETFAKHTLHITSNGRKALCLLSDRVYVLGPLNAVRVFLERSADKKAGPLSDALKTAAKKHAEVVGINGVAVAKALKAIPRELPPQAKPFLPLLKAHHATMVFDLDDEVRGNVRVVFAKEEDARAGEKSVKAALSLAQAGLGMGIKEMARQKEAGAIVDLLRKMESSLKAAQVEQKGATVQVAARMKVDAMVLGVTLMEAVQKVRSAAARAQSQNNLRQLGLAMHNYHDTYGHFPPAAIYDKDGKPGLSWRVQLLPFLDQTELYKQFHLDEPWDSAHNKKLLAKMPRVFASPEDPSTTRTHFLAFTGMSTIFEGKKGIRIAQIPDGTSNTIMFVQATKTVPWTKPEDLPFDPTKPLPKLGITPKKGFQAAMCDGAVRFFSAKITPANLKAYITRDGGEVISED